MHPRLYDWRRCIRIRTLHGGEPESYAVSVTDEGVTVTGADSLGTAYGIYAFSTKCLEVLPVYRMVDVFPEIREELVLENRDFSSEKRQVRFRGWFVNDEDLLTEFKISGGRRRLDYSFYQDVIFPCWKWFWKLPCALRST